MPDGDRYSLLLAVAPLSSPKVCDGANPRLEFKGLLSATNRDTVGRVSEDGAWVRGLTESAGASPPIVTPHQVRYQARRAAGCCQTLGVRFCGGKTPMHLTTFNPCVA
jgi:hypothetical protein